MLKHIYNTLAYLFMLYMYLYIYSYLYTYNNWVFPSRQEIMSKCLAAMPFRSCLSRHTSNHQTAKVASAAKCCSIYSRAGSRWTNIRSWRDIHFHKTKQKRIRVEIYVQPRACTRPQAAICSAVHETRGTTLRIMDREGHWRTTPAWPSISPGKSSRRIPSGSTIL